MKFVTFFLLCGKVVPLVVPLVEDGGRVDKVTSDSFQTFVHNTIRSHPKQLIY